jgi:hypothetical protein
MKAVVVAMLGVVVALPFARREGWAGWVALVMIGAAAVVMWGLILRGLWSGGIIPGRRRRDPSE